MEQSKTKHRSPKSFDSVKMMREIRDKVSIETQDMTLGELKEYIQNQKNRKPSK